MKVFKHTFIVALAGLVLFACEKDELNLDSTTLKAKAEKSEEVKMVPFKANLSSTPMDDSELIACINPDELPYAVAKLSTVSGNATHLGKLNWIKSPLTVNHCEFDPITGNFTVELDMIFKNKNGDGIHIFGESIMHITGPATGEFLIIDGFGKFKDASGELLTEGFLNVEAGTTVFRAEGMVTQPNH